MHVIGTAFAVLRSLNWQARRDAAEEESKPSTVAGREPASNTRCKLSPLPRKASEWLWVLASSERLDSCALVHRVPQNRASINTARPEEAARKLGRMRVTYDDIRQLE